MIKSLFIFLFILFSFGLTTQERSVGKCHMSHVTYHMNEYGKIVHRPCGSCISSVQEIEENFIKFFLLTQTWSEFNLSWLKPYA